MQLTSFILSLPLLAAASPLLLRQNPVHVIDAPTCWTGGVSYTTADMDGAVAALLNNYALNAAPQTLTGNQLWSGVQGAVYAYVANNSPCNQDPLSAENVHEFFDGIKATCGAQGGASYWSKDEGDAGKGIYIGFLDAAGSEEYAKYLLPNAGKACTQ